MSRLPKQWLYWANLFGLKPEQQRGRNNGFYLIGRGRRWRVNIRNEFECSCPLVEFDRWANSFGARVELVPKTESDFLKVVKQLHSLTSEQKA